MGGRTQPAFWGVGVSSTSSTTRASEVSSSPRRIDFLPFPLHTLTIFPIVKHETQQPKHEVLRRPLPRRRRLRLGLLLLRNLAEGRHLQRCLHVHGHRNGSQRIRTHRTSRHPYHHGGCRLQARRHQRRICHPRLQ